MELQEKASRKAKDVAGDLVGLCQTSLLDL